MPGVVVRAVAPDEWRRMREFRLEAVRDEAAPVAFLASPEQVAAFPDELWRERALAGSEAAGADARQRAIVAVGDGAWIGTLTVLVTEAGGADFTGQTVEVRTADVVGVYVAPSARGRGVVQALLDAAAEWVAVRGLAELQLFVDVRNPRAQRAYEKAGFALTGDAIELDGRHELRMARPLSGTTAS